MTCFEIAAKASFQNPTLFLPNFSMHLRLISAKWKIICEAMWEPQGRIITDTFLPQGISRHTRVPRHSRMLGLWVLQPGLIARDHHRSTGGQANAGSFLYSLSLQSRAVSELSLSPSQILRGSRPRLPYTFLPSPAQTLGMKMGGGSTEYRQESDFPELSCQRFPHR